jgi:hypothetical protein
MNDEFGRIRKEPVAAEMRYYRGISLEGMRKTKNTLIQDNRGHGGDSYRVTSEFNSRALLQELVWYPV